MGSPQGFMQLSPSVGFACSSKGCIFLLEGRHSPVVSFSVLLSGGLVEQDFEDVSLRTHTRVRASA